MKGSLESKPSLTENFICMVNLGISPDSNENHWIKRGVILITQLND